MGIKLVLAPALALLFCNLLGQGSLPARAAILEAGMPPMITAGALAVIAGLEPRLAVAMVGLGMLVSFATLPLLALWL